MDCKIVHRHLIAYQEDNLQPGFKSNLEAHFLECTSCKQLLAGIQSVEAIIDKAKAADPNPFMTTRIIQHIENELTGRGIKQDLALRPIFVTLTVICAMVMGYAIGKSSFDRVNGYDNNKNQIENLKTGLFIHDFIDENKTLFVNE